MTDALDPPPLDDLTADEVVFLRACLGWVRGNAEMWRSRLMEAHVGRILDADFPLLGNSPWDLKMDGIRIQVRATQEHVAFKLGGVGVDVFVFVQKPTGTNDMTDARYIVAPAADVAALGQSTMAPRRLAERFESCSADELAAKVTEAARTSA